VRYITAIPAVLALVAIDEDVVGDDAVEERGCPRVIVFIDLLAKGALEGPRAGSIKRGGVLASRTASNVEH
jgi:hypothetical protein